MKCLKIVDELLILDIACANKGHEITILAVCGNGSCSETKTHFSACYLELANQDTSYIPDQESFLRGA
jgi:hypothetical protein